MNTEGLKRIIKEFERTNGWALEADLSNLHEVGYLFAKGFRKNLHISFEKAPEKEPILCHARFKYLYSFSRIVRNEEEFKAFLEAAFDV